MLERGYEVCELMNIQPRHDMPLNVRESPMPAKSKAQQMAAGAALSAKRGARKVGSLKGASKSMYESMDKKQLKDFASTPQKGKPLHKSKH
jgi:hypothetical protein